MAAPFFFRHKFLKSFRMKNYKQRGDILDFTAPSGGYTSGQLVVVGELTGVANIDAAENEICAVSMEGVYTLPKGNVAISAGAAVYSDAGADVNTTNTDTLVGYAIETVASGDATVQVRLSN